MQININLKQGNDFKLTNACSLCQKIKCQLLINDRFSNLCEMTTLFALSQPYRIVSPFANNESSEVRGIIKPSRRLK